MNASFEPIFDRTKTLEQLDGHDWGEPNSDSHLVMTCHRLRLKPLSEFNVEDLRIMIGQKIGLSYLMPIALERLEDDPLAAGDYYCGDLLSMVVVVEESFWNTRPDLLQRIRKVVQQIKESSPSLANIEQQTVQRILMDTNRSLME